jgi:hypothetical protein
MKVPAKYLNKFVEVTWRDPNFRRVTKGDPCTSGREALATWKEYGVITEIKDGVLTITHSAGKEPDEDEYREFLNTWIAEWMVEGIRVFKPMRKK